MNAAAAVVRAMQHRWSAMLGLLGSVCGQQDTQVVNIKARGSDSQRRRGHESGSLNSEPGPLMMRAAQCTGQHGGAILLNNRPVSPQGV